MQYISPQDALRHPNWDMGAKVTIDSATMMNKGLEVIEARWLFDIPPEKLEVLIHPESIVHSMVEYIDGVVMAQLGIPDMRIPIAYALGYPERLDMGLKSLNLVEIGNLTFEKPDTGRFPALRLAYEAIDKGKSFPAVMNAANEIAVSAFLNGRVSFLQIPDVVLYVMDHHEPMEVTLDTVLEADRQGRELAEAYIKNHLKETS
jgi:1-deoxy-D-xylulose-5-phosphate reductoisomerase